MNGNRLPPGPSMSQQDGRMNQDRRRSQYNQHNQHQHQHYNQQPAPMYNGYAQPYNPASYNPPYNPAYHPNPMTHHQGYYPYPPPYMPQYQNPGLSPANNYAGYPPTYGRTPPPAAPIPQYNPNAQFIPAAAQPRPQPPSVQPSPIVSSTDYQNTPNYSQIPEPPRTSSQSSARPSTPPLPQITEPLYAEPESPEPKQRVEIFVPPVPWFPSASRVPWLIKYTGPKDQNPDLVGYFVWVANPMQISRLGSVNREIQDFFATVLQESSSAAIPTPPNTNGKDNTDAPPIVPEAPTASEISNIKNAEDVENQVEDKIESDQQESPVESHAVDATQESQEPASEEREPSTEEEKVEHSEEPSDESKTLSARSEFETEAASQHDGDNNPPYTPQSDHQSPSGQPITENDKPSSPAAKPRKTQSVPQLWTGLFKGTGASTAAPANDTLTSTTEVSSTASSSVGRPKNESLADALNTYVTGARENKIAFLEPRGLVNTGNMCYMNSVLQVLVFCIPFYDFLDQVGKRSAYSFKSDTPLLDAMIMFTREFNVIDSAVSVEKLRMRLKDNELEKYGEQFTPDYIYEVIRRLPRFSTMERGRQQDAEEFLGFFLEGLHEECAQIMQSSSTASSSMTTPTNRPASPASEAGNAEGDAGWHEVGRKQRAAVTRSSGTIKTSSPITKIFGGTLRSEFRVPGLPHSITLQPFQPLQLDIGSPQVNNIIDALKVLTRPETIHGDFKSPRNAKTATKQVFIDTLPQVLILHLKRFEYNNNTGGTQKIWKKIGYPLELELPKEIFSRQHQTTILNHEGLPKYRLIAVVYHHGKNASGGHYTVDVRRQEGREWIRLDDTIIRRIKSEDVAEGGSEEEAKVLAAGTKASKKDSSMNQNPFSGMDVDDEDADSESKDGWQKVNGSSHTNGSSKSWSAVANGANTAKTGTAAKSKADKFSMKDNKVAYLLFYEKI